MSHYTCLIATKEYPTKERIAEKLAPYDEANDDYNNSEGYWDWYVIGGRWENALLGENTIQRKDILSDRIPHIPYAFISLRGTWMSKGVMGWWGFSSDTEQQQAMWQQMFFNAYIKSLPMNTYLTLVDLHT